MKKFYKGLSFAVVAICLITSFNLTAQNLLENPGFENGVVAPWFGDNGNTVTIVTEAAGGTYAAEGNAAQNVELIAGVEYELKCKAKIIANPGGERVWIGVRASTALVQNQEIYGTTWEDMFIEFTAPETGPHKFWVWGQGASSYASDSWELVVKGTSGVNDQEAQDKIQIINDANGISITMNKIESDAKIMIHDISGKQLYAATTSESTTIIDRSAFPTSEIYIVTVLTENLHRVERLALISH